jgi:hypothetical protein
LACIFAFARRFQRLAGEERKSSPLCIEILIEIRSRALFNPSMAQLPSALRANLADADRNAQASLGKKSRYPDLEGSPRGAVGRAYPIAIRRHP